MTLPAARPGASPLAPAWLRVPEDPNALAAGVWSRNAVRAASGELELAGVPASALAAEFGTPLYVVDEADVRARAAETRAAFDAAMRGIGTTARVYYAGKAFLCTEVVRWIAEAGLGIDVASEGELAVALAGGADPARIGVHGNNKSGRQIARAVEAGVGAIVIDSAIEVERVAAAAARAGRVQPVRLRINSGVHASTHEYLATAREDQKFGVATTDAPGIVAAIRALPGLAFLGLHSHIGSQIFETQGFAEAARRLLALHARLLADGPVPELNLGGGFGIAYTVADDPMPISAIAEGMAAALAEAAADLGVALPAIAVEPGRSIVGPAGTTLYTVGTVKPVTVAVPDGAAADEAATAVRKYVSVDGGMSDNVRPALYGADYSARIASRASGDHPALARVVGMHCESGDVVARDEYLPMDVGPGDLLAVPATGAYGWAMASNYNWVPRPPVVAVRDGAARIIVRGETIDDLLARDPGVRP
ncbi:MAG: diaminopimelate decarboxylase [Micrococcales bacterium 73-13]|nr:MAG: diaminopimelate decarboxylase [Micrococcales bacterium 73-13]